mmetsp:Transcript_78454/g.227737  ORF Transcript_78454/g.227737 Transcript_78454/m.227737 type:complete len:234 (+) Transcript_78454:515-1216(+)
MPRSWRELVRIIVVTPPSCKNSTKLLPVACLPAFWLANATLPGEVAVEAAEQSPSLRDRSTILSSVHASGSFRSTLLMLLGVAVDSPLLVKEASVAGSTSLPTLLSFLSASRPASVKGNTYLTVSGFGSTAVVVGSAETITRPGINHAASKTSTMLLCRLHALVTERLLERQSASNHLRPLASAMPSQQSSTRRSLTGSGLLSVAKEQMKRRPASAANTSASSLADIDFRRTM